MQVALDDLQGHHLLANHSDPFLFGQCSGEDGGDGLTLSRARGAMQHDVLGFFEGDQSGGLCRVRGISAQGSQLDTTRGQVAHFLKLCF